MKNRFIMAVAAVAAVGMANSADALLYDEEVTNNQIQGSGVTNGGYTVDRTVAGLELGLRGKLRHDPSSLPFPGRPANEFNSNGDGTYSFANIAASNPSNGLPFVDNIATPYNEADTGIWSFEWSINTDYLDPNSAGSNLDNYIYQLGIDIDISQGTNFITFDVIHGANPNGSPFWDHSIGDNNTGESLGTEATDAASYGGLIDVNNLAQNSWKPLWYMPSFDPTANATYTFYLAAYSVTDTGFTNPLAYTEIDIIAGAGGAPIPEPATMTLLGLGLAGLAVRARKGMKKS